MTEQREIVRALFRAALGREPDERRLPDYDRIFERPLPAAIQALAESLLASPEFGARMAWRGLPPHEATDDRAPIISLGTHCFTAALLRETGLRKFSGPFDWVFSDLRLVGHCILDGFKMLLDRSQYIVRDDEGRCGHAFYSEAYNRPIIFNHHRVATDDRDYQKIVRAVDRFRNVLDAGGGLFVVVTTCDRATEKAVSGLSDALHVATAGHRLIVVRVLRPSPHILSPALIPPLKAGDTWVYEMRPLSRLGALSFPNQQDNAALSRLARLHYAQHLADVSAVRVNRS
jgi:hypothetical protein